MKDRDVPLKAYLALEALKVQAAMAKGTAKLNPAEHYRALQGMAENEPWTSRIIRAAKASQNPLDFAVLGDDWLYQLAFSTIGSQRTEIEARDPQPPLTTGAP